MEDFNIEVMKERQKYIRIRMIGVGTVASGICVDLSLYNDTQKYSIIKEEDIFEGNLGQFIDDSDIVFLVADMSDDFVVANILKITKIITHSNKLFVSILANVDSNKDGISVILKDLREKSSILVVENQYDISLNPHNTMQQKFTKIISGLLNLIDVEIGVLRALEYDFSSLITMNSFFEQKFELYLYSNYSIKNFKKIPDIRAKLEDLSQIWIRFYLEENDYAKSKSFIEYIISAIDEDASYHLTYKTDGSKILDEIEVTTLISVLNSDSKEKSIKKNIFL
ncbi:MAG: hypothetical protein L0Y61_02825 [Epsilonproteobacteria bacterium]|nr:hypothetical protein [Campylobacterota bacterium]